MAKIVCVKLHNEHGLYILPGVVEVSDGLRDYLLSNYPGSFEPYNPNVSADVMAADMTSPPVQPDIEAGEAAEAEAADAGASDGDAEETGAAEADLDSGAPVVADFESPPADKMVRKPRRRKARS